MAAWFDSFVFDLTQLVVLLVEAFIAKRIYNAVKGRIHYQKQLAQIRLIASVIQPPQIRAQSPNTTTRKGSGKAEHQIAPLLMLRDQIPTTPHPLWDHIATCTSITSVFVVVFLMVSFFLRPITNQWALSLVPICLPLIFVPLPYLLRMNSPSTFSSLFLG